MIPISEEKRVLRVFQHDVDEHLNIINDEVKKGNIDETLLWLKELINMRDFWLDIFNKPAVVYRSGSFARGFKLSTAKDEEAHQMAEARVKIAKRGIKIAEGMLQSKGWKP